MPAARGLGAGDRPFAPSESERLTKAAKGPSEPVIYEEGITSASTSAVVARHDGHAGVGGARSLALRLEDLELATEEERGMNNIRGIVVRVNYLGTATNARVRVGETTLVVSIPRGKGLAREGEQVVVRWRSSSGILLSEGS